jgi:GAF domain-containing protein
VEKRDRSLAEALGDFAVEMQAQPGTDATLKIIVAATVGLIPEASWAGISLIENRQVRPAVPTDEIAEALDHLQTKLGEGPMFDALYEHPTVHIPDLAQETRWPRFVAEATGRGVRCMLSLRLFTSSRSLGALNVYGSAPGVFSEESVNTAEILAQHAAVGVAGAAAQEQFQAALASRDLIGQAKGILMQRDGLTGLQAFATLTNASQQTNIKLIDVARWLINEHEIKLSNSDS